MPMEEPRVPNVFEGAIHAKCLQIVLVLSPKERSIPARLWLLERASAEQPWQTAVGPIAVTLGPHWIGVGGWRALGRPARWFADEEGR
jgi:hypothetical protein